MSEEIPKMIFIIPYRDRKNQLGLFRRQMEYVLEDIPKQYYKIYFIHQCDDRDFNRGAMRNIGFLVMKEKYPNDYQNITFVFNDVDTMPYEKNMLNYETSHGNVKHFFGFENTLGGIVCIKGKDFESTTGYPNLWSWGYEDNLLKIRVSEKGLNIDRSQFYKLTDNKEIIQLTDSILKSVNKEEFKRYMYKTDEGFHSISHLTYTIDEGEQFINVTHFLTPYANNKSTNTVHDVRKGPTPFAASSVAPKSKSGMKMTFQTLF